MIFIKLSSVADERHYGVKLPVLLQNFNKQEFVSMFEKDIFHLSSTDISNSVTYM